MTSAPRWAINASASSAYELGGTCVNIDLLRLKSKEEVLKGK